MIQNKAKKWGVAGRVPFRCPVCEGRGDVSGDFYYSGQLATYSSRATCRTCNGGGIVWSK